MVRLADLPPDERQHLLAKAMDPLSPPAFVSTRKPLSKRRVALITTAGLHLRDEPSFDLMDASYRVIPGDLRGDELVMSHPRSTSTAAAFRKT